jgi:hypothetical protein
VSRKVRPRSARLVVQTLQVISHFFPLFISFVLYFFLSFFSFFFLSFFLLLYISIFLFFLHSSAPLSVRKCIIFSRNGKNNLIIFSPLYSIIWTNVMYVLENWCKKLFPWKLTMKPQVSEFTCLSYPINDWFKHFNSFWYFFLISLNVSTLFY